MNESLINNSKPPEVVLAVNILWVSLLVGLAKLILDQARISAMGPAWLANFIFVFISLLFTFLILKISSGKNWARIVCLIFFVLGLLPAFPIILKEFGAVPIVGALSVLQVLLQAYALFLLFFSTGRAWFGKSKKVNA